MKLLKNRTVLGAVCIVLSLLICFALTPLFNQSVSQKATVVRVIENIQSGDQITKDMVQTVEVGGYNLPKGVIKQTDSVVGKYATADLSPGDYILSDKLSDTTASENAYLYSLDGTKEAISVSIKSLAEGLSGKLTSGDIVSVIAPDYKKQGSTVIPPELTYIKVIGVTASSGYDTDSEQASEDTDQAEEENQLPATVTLLATPEQAKILAELESEGSIHLSLVYRGSEDKSDEFLKVQDKLLEALYPKAAQEQNGTSSDTVNSNDSASTDGSEVPESEGE